MTSHKIILIASATSCALSAMALLLILSYPCLVEDTRALFPQTPICPDYHYKEDHTNFIRWTPDNTKIIFDFDTFEHADQSIWSINEDGTNLTRIAEGKPYDWLTNGQPGAGPGSVHGFHADLSPDGTMLVYSVCDTDKKDLQFPDDSEPGSYDLAITRMDGTKPRIITPDQG